LSRHIAQKISPRPSLPSGPEALWAGGQRGGIPPFGLQPRAVSDPEGKGREEGFSLQRPYNYGLISKCCCGAVLPCCCGAVLQYSDQSPVNK
jgi:hypothetical protein